MIDSNDYIMKSVGSQGRQNKFYRTSCNSCGADKGYLLKVQDKRPGCNKCTIRPKHTEEAKLKMSIIAMGNKHSSKAYRDILVVETKIDGRTTRDKSTYKAAKKFLTERQVQIRHNVRTLIWQKLKNRSITRKTNKTFILLGYSSEDLIKHLESRFEVGMSWDNYGVNGWHIDHKTPDSWFQYSSTDDEAFRLSWALDNLQPMWAHLNHSKGNRYASSSKS